MGWIKRYIKLYYEMCIDLLVVCNLKFVNEIELVKRGDNVGWLFGWIYKEGDLY